MDILICASSDCPLWRPRTVVLSQWNGKLVLLKNKRKSQNPTDRERSGATK